MEGSVPRLVVATEEEDVVGVAQLEAEEEHDGFERVVAAVHEVPDEDVARLWWLPSCVMR